MKAVILAAGEGKRLRPHTLTTPKPLLKLKGKPILEHTLNNLPNKIREVIFVVGYKGDQIENYFGGEFGGRKLFYVFQPEPKGTFNALACAEKYLDEHPFLGLVGDDLLKKPDLERLVSYNASVLTSETKNPERFGICRVGEDNCLAEIVEKPSYPCGNLAHTGAFVLDKKIFQEPIQYSQSGEELLAPMIGSLAKRAPIKVVKASFWFPIGYPDDLKLAERYVS